MRRVPILRRVVLIIFVLAACALIVPAQSGRRSTSKPITPAPPVPEASPSLAKPKQAARLQILLVSKNPNPLNQPPYYLPDTVLKKCARRLEQAPNVLATISPEHMTR